MIDDASLLSPGDEIVIRLRLTCEVHDDALVGHLDRVAHYACELATALKLAPADIAKLRLAAPLHDIGKVALPLELLNKPGRLTPAEMEIIKSHTTIGHHILCGSRWPVVQLAADIAHAHHENWDGSGYPHAIPGEKIPLLARIVAIADVYDALRSPRTYKPAWTLEQAIEELSRQRAIKFDPYLLDAFLKNLHSMPHAQTPDGKQNLPPNPLHPLPARISTQLSPNPVET